MNPETLDARFLQALLSLRFEFDEKAFLRSRRLLLSYRSLGPDILRCRGATHLKSVLYSFRHASWRVHIDQFRVFSFQCSGHSKGRKLLQRCRQQNCRSHVSGGPTQCLQSSLRPRSPMLLSARFFLATSCVLPPFLDVKKQYLHCFACSPTPTTAFIDQVLDDLRR